MLLIWLLLVSHIAINDNTPGVLCTKYDPDFDGLRYPEQIAHCARNMTAATKAVVAERYHIKRADYHLYEFDHLIPLALGGSNSAANIWPQPLEEARQKDTLEVDLYYLLKGGKVTQRVALNFMIGWHYHPKAAVK